MKGKVFGWLTIVSFAGMIVGLVILAGTGWESMAVFQACRVAMFAGIAFLVLWLIFRDRKPKQPKAEVPQSEYIVNEGAWERERAEKARAKYEEKRKRQEYRAAVAEREREDRLPVAAVIVNTKTETGKSALGTAARGAVGYALFGVFGAAVGVTSGKNRVTSQKVTFSVRYASGRTGVEIVEVGTKRFEELARLVV